MTVPPSSQSASQRKQGPSFLELLVGRLVALHVVGGIVYGIGQLFQ